MASFWLTARSLEADSIRYASKVVPGQESQRPALSRFKHQLRAFHTAAPHSRSGGVWKSHTMHSAATADVGQLTKQLLQLPFPPHSPLVGSEKGSFAYTTIATRLPSIIANIVKDLETEAAAVASSDSSAAEEFRAAADGIRTLREEMLADAMLQPLTSPPAARRAGLPDMVAWTNATLQPWQQHTGGAAGTWFSLPWLVIECYLYVRIACVLEEQPHLAATAYDPFRRQKRDAFEKSVGSVVDIAKAVQAVLQAEDGDAKQQLFELMQYSLWGNKTDLSMLVDASNIATGSLADEVSASRGAAHPYLIVDDFEAVWELLSARRSSNALAGSSNGSSSSSGGGNAAPRVDIILDNAGLELYGDLCLADLLISRGFASQVVFHGKLLPWFVSDVLQRDFTETVQECCSSSSSSSSADDGENSSSISATGGRPVGSSSEAVRWLGQRWASYLRQGKWQYTDHPFWTTPLPFSHLSAAAPDLHAQLSQSALLVFKGDLNYRKLAYDCRWPWDTPFAEALCGFRPAPLVSLRTLKADVMAGLRPGQGEELSKVDAEWETNGKFGVVQFRP